MRRPQRRYPPGINPGPMADIAFMMLIFFMVTTTVEMNWGIEMKLAPWTDEVNAYPPLQMPILFLIDINSQNEIMANAEIVKAEEVKWMCRLFIKDHVERGLITVVQFRVNRHAAYKVYISVLDEVKAAFNMLWNEESMRLYNKKYNFTSRYEKRRIRRKYPFAMMDRESNIYLYTY